MSKSIYWKHKSKKKEFYRDEYEIQISMVINLDDMGIIYLSMVRL